MLLILVLCAVVFLAGTFEIGKFIFRPNTSVHNYRKYASSLGNIKNKLKL